jgi:hypothetical protein
MGTIRTDAAVVSRDMAVGGASDRMTLVVTGTSRSSQ